MKNGSTARRRTGWAALEDFEIGRHPQHVRDAAGAGPHDVIMRDDVDRGGRILQRLGRFGYRGDLEMASSSIDSRCRFSMDSAASICAAALAGLRTSPRTAANTAGASQRLRTEQCTLTVPLCECSRSETRSAFSRTAKSGGNAAVQVRFRGSGSFAVGRRGTSMLVDTSRPRVPAQQASAQICLDVSPRRP